MKQLALTKKHFEILAEYGLKNVPPEECIPCFYKAGETVINEGMPIARLFIAVRGRAKAGRISGDGKRLVICRYISGGMMGEVELLTGRKTANTSITAITDFEAVSVSYKYCRRELSQNVAFSNIIGKVLAESRRAAITATPPPPFIPASSGFAPIF